METEVKDWAIVVWGDGAGSAQSIHPHLTERFAARILREVADDLEGIADEAGGPPDGHAHVQSPSRGLGRFFKTSKRQEN